MSPDEFERLRDRVYKEADRSQSQEVRLHEHELRLKRIDEQVLSLQVSSVTNGQLAAAVDLLTAKMTMFHNDLTSIKSQIGWGVGLVVAAFIAAVAKLVFM